MNQDYPEIVLAIVNAQIEIIGPLAVDQAKKVDGLQLDWEHKQVNLSRNPTEIINDLVEQYKQLFGQISVDVCKEAVSRLVGHMAKDQLPTSLM